MLIPMPIIEFLILLLIAGIVGFIAQSLIGYRGGSFLVTIALGFIGAVFGTWLARRLGLPDFFSIRVGDVDFPVVWAIIGAILFVGVVALTIRGGYRWNVTPPSRVVLVLSVLFGILSLLQYFGIFSVGVDTWILMALAWIVLLLGNLVRGL
jgi:uncharacterized membrane protein YeaQ/YmgE (transglycosylase-associated protein family)